MLKKIFKNNLYFIVHRSSFSVQKGVSIYLVILISTFILAVALGLSTILISRIKVSREIGYSVVALYAADTGIERILYAIRGAEGYDPNNCFPPPPPPCATPYSEILSNGASYSVYIKNITSTSTQINSIGTYQTVKRAIEISY